jgi:hypothetical protein
MFLAAVAFWVQVTCTTGDSVYLGPYSGVPQAEACAQDMMGTWNADPAARECTFMPYYDCYTEHFGWMPWRDVSDICIIDQLSYGKRHKSIQAP